MSAAATGGAVIAVETLVLMANQIGDFFRPWPHERAVRGIADHLQKYWDPRMRAALKAHVAAGGAGLHQQVIEATPLVMDGPLSGEVKLIAP